MSKSAKTKFKAKAASGGESDFARYGRVLPRMALAWIGLLVATAVASLCPRFSAYYLAYILVTAGLAAGSLAFLDAIYRKGKARLHAAFKKFLGYGLVLHYAAAALPRVDWAGDGSIGQGRVAYLFVLAMICLLAGAALFVASGRPGAFAALGLLTDEEARHKELRKKRLAARNAERFANDRKKRVLHGALEWVDALGFAAILVILINTFVFQLYQIPSESMVPAFLQKDRPFTSKITAGPRIPLTDWRLPFVKLPKRGDIITLANPRYPENQSVNLKKYLSQLVSMVTFTAVTIDRYLPSGSEKADPLVKRIVGLPGEKLMMVDDVLYSKGKEDSAFSPVEADKAWAQTDLWKAQASGLAGIEQIPIDEAHRGILSAWDQRRRGANAAALAASAAASAKAIASRPSAAQASAFLASLQKGKAQAFKLVSDDIKNLQEAKTAEGNPLATAGTRADDLALALAVSTSAALKARLEAYAACPSATLAGSNDYERSGRLLNLLIKDNLLRRVARMADLIAGGASFDSLYSDASLAALTKEGSELDYYVNGLYGGGLYDQRNFPEFPAGGEYLGPEQYFAMGDNRYNSLDFRYRTETGARLRSFDPADPDSVRYVSNIDPFQLDLRFIEGYALFRIWPLSRIGAIR